MTRVAKIEQSLEVLSFIFYASSLLWKMICVKQRKRDVHVPFSTPGWIFLPYEKPEKTDQKCFLSNVVGYISNHMFL